MGAVVLVVSVVVSTRSGHIQYLWHKPSIILRSEYGMTPFGQSPQDGHATQIGQRLFGGVYSKPSSHDNSGHSGATGHMIAAWT